MSKRLADWISLDSVQAQDPPRLRQNDDRAARGLKSNAEPPPSAETRLSKILHLEHRGEPLAPRRIFAARVSLAVLVWLVMALLTLLVGMLGYAGFEGMSPVDAYVNAAMVLSGMGEVEATKTMAGKLFAGFFALFSGLFMLVATGVVLAPIVHRILHRFHAERGKGD